VNSRSPDRIRAHYAIERELSDRLRKAPADRRLVLYGEVYDELFERVPDHPMLCLAADETARTANVEGELRFLRRFLRADTAFLELGAGDCALSRRVATMADAVYAVDVSESLTAAARESGEIHVVLSDGISVDVPRESMTLAYSNQLMEHLHPDDALKQLRNVWLALVPGGLYVCVTPNRLNGPHDVSKYFDRVATGFHLKEYTVNELSRLMRATGFSEVASYAHVRGKTARVPLRAVTSLETVLQLLPHAVALKMASSRPWRWLLGIRLVARKAGG
jgi:SAM-dependent methyltransferase